MNAVDYTLLAGVAISAVLGVMRGFLREVIALLTWILALFLAWQLGPQLEPHLGGLLSGPMVRPWAARAIIFLAVLLIGVASAASVSYFVRLSIFSSLDRFLGLLFGLMRGAVVIGVLVILCQLVQLDREPWWRQSTLLPYAEGIADFLRALVGERLVEVERELTVLNDPNLERSVQRCAG
jgi:membrane protein required for colicin V production